MAVGLYAEEKISNLSVAFAAAGSGITLSKVGLYSSTGVQLAVSADQGTSWQTSGIKTIPLITPYVVAATGTYYVGILVVFTTSGPTCARTTGAGVFQQFALAGKLAAYYAQAGQTDLPNPATFNASPSVSTGTEFWCGLS